MICGRCNGTIKITHTYPAGTAGKTSRGECEGCKRAFTLVTIVVCESKGYGNGAAALAKKISKNGNDVALQGV